MVAKVGENHSFDARHGNLAIDGSSVVIIGKTELSRVLGGVDKNTVDSWIRTKNLPVKREGGRGKSGEWLFDMVEVMRWHSDYLLKSRIEAELKKALEETDDGDGRPMSMKDRGERADVLMKEYELAKVQQVTIRLDDALQVIEDRIAPCVPILTTLDTRYAGRTVVAANTEEEVGACYREIGAEILGLLMGTIVVGSNEGLVVEEEEGTDG